MSRCATWPLYDRRDARAHVIVEGWSPGWCLATPARRPRRRCTRGEIFGLLLWASGHPPTYKGRT